MTCILYEMWCFRGMGESFSLTTLALFVFLLSLYTDSLPLSLASVQVVDLIYRSNDPST